MKQYKAIFLDWDDTIGDWASAERNALRDVHALYHLEAIYPTYEDFIAAYKPYNLELWGMYGRGEVTKEWLHLQRFLRPIEGLRVAGDGLQELAHEMGDKYLQLTNRYFSLLPGAAEAVRALAARYPLTIISNGFKEIQHYKFTHSGLEDCFVHRIISEEAGVNKPRPEIFRIALERNGVQAEEAVMIGDSYSSDIAGAKAAGIDQIWVHSGPAEETATYIVPSLEAAKEMLV